MSKKQFILVVDDDPDLVEAVSMKLEALEYRVAKAYDGEEAMEKINEEKPDIMILDVMMPRKNGWEVCNDVKTSDTLKDIVVILLTAVADSVKTTSYTHHDGKTTLADDYIPKPIDLDKLMEIVGDNCK
jgi:two-component system, OmpR family, alkaline phosphatase synthesis response regulator PhoP